jgi:hypothetical protein
MKIEKRMSCRNYDIPNTIGFNFNGQRSFRSTTKRTKRIIQNRMISNIMNCGMKNYGFHRAYPGQKVWVVTQGVDNILRVDWDIVDEIYAVGEIGSGGLRDVWLTYYGIGHACEIDQEVFLNKNAALYAMSKCAGFYRPYREFKW